MVIVGAAMRRLIHLAFGVLKSGRAYEAQMAPPLTLDTVSLRRNSLLPDLTVFGFGATLRRGEGGSSLAEARTQGDGRRVVP